jgi:hypothetical protein
MTMAQKFLETLEKSHSTHPHQHQAQSHACTVPVFITVASNRMMAPSGASWHTGKGRGVGEWGGGAQTKGSFKNSTTVFFEK